MTTPSKYPTKKIEVSKIHSNISQEVIEITLDRMRLILSQHIKEIEKLSEWQAALGILLAITLTLCTANFNTTFGVQGDVWKAIFIICLIVSVFWLIKALVRLFRADSLEDLIEKIKRGE